MTTTTTTKVTPMDMLTRYLTESEQRKLLHAAKALKDPLAQRDHHWMRLLIETGMRIAELASLSAAQAQAALTSGYIVVRPEQRKASPKGKRRGHEYLVTEPVRACLVALLRLQRCEVPLYADQEPPLIWGREGQALSVRTYQARMKLWASEAGLSSKLSPHWLRHTRGANIVRRSGSANPAKVAQLALGHASMASTSVYLGMCREEYLQALQATAGSGRLSKRAARRAGANVQPAGQGGAQ